jgi:hypothetical protein
MKNAAHPLQKGACTLQISAFFSFFGTRAPRAPGVKNRQTVKSLPDTVQKAIRVFYLLII